MSDRDLEEEFEHFHDLYTDLVHNIFESMCMKLNELSEAEGPVQWDDPASVERLQALLDKLTDETNTICANILPDGLLLYLSVDQERTSVYIGFREKEEQ